MVLAASRTVGEVMRPGAIVVYESTVYPGATEEDCVSVLEKASSAEALGRGRARCEGRSAAREGACARRLVAFVS